MSTYGNVTTDQPPKRRRISAVRWMISILVLLPLLVIWSLFLFDQLKSFQVVSASMSPTLEVGDCVLMRKEAAFTDLNGYIVAFSDPKGSDETLTKRVVADGNTTVRLRNGNLYLDSSKEPLPGDTIAYVPNRKWEVLPEQVFVVGDNRNDSFDSIDFGPIPRSSILGVITYRYWPWDRKGRIQ